MRDFLLVVPDLVLAAAGADVDGDGLARGRPRADESGAAPGITRLRFGAAEALPHGWRAFLAACFGRPDLEATAPAAVVAGALPDDLPAPGPGGREAPAPWLATPLHLVAGLETVHLPRNGILRLEAAERAELAASFDAALGGGRLRLRAAAADAFVLDGLDVGPVAAIDPLACLGGGLLQAQPTGVGAAALRRLMAEIEMWLHDHPVNLARAGRGLPAVRSLWLWGASAPERPVASAGLRQVSSAAPSVPVPADPLRAHSDDAWVRAAAQLAGVALAPEDDWPSADAFDGTPGVLVATARLHGAANGDLAQFERRHLAPALEALRAGRLERLAIAGADRAVRLHAADRWRVWRPRRSWLGALGA